MQSSVLNADQSAAGNRADVAYQVLRAEILSGGLVPGQRLRAADLDARFQLGLTPIREALMRLGTEDLVVTESNRGASVKGVSVADFCDLMQTRRRVERLCLQDSITQGGAEWEAELVASLHMLSRMPLPGSDGAAASAGQWEQCHRRFHLGLVGACGSPWMLRFWNQLVDHSERYRKLRLTTELVPRNVTAEHEDLLEAALARNVERVTELMEQHLQGTERAILAMLAQDASPAKNGSDG